jgi:predicted ribosomally synthesized peptide with nif11-like leader
MVNFELTEELKEKLENAGSLDEMVQIVNEAGVSFTKEQLEQMLAGAEAGELNEDDLDAVAGGASLTQILRQAVRVVVLYLRQVRR